jgi:hypothetical protein
MRARGAESNASLLATLTNLPRGRPGAGRYEDGVRLLESNLDFSATFLGTEGEYAFAVGDQGIVSTREANPDKFKSDSRSCWDSR